MGGGVECSIEPTSSSLRKLHPILLPLYFSVGGGEGPHLKHAWNLEDCLFLPSHQAKEEEEEERRAWAAHGCNMQVTVGAAKYWPFSVHCSL